MYRSTNVFFFFPPPYFINFSFALVRYYKTLWRCVSLEMEGSYYARCAQKMANLGFLRRDIAHRYLYYVSDLPLDTNSNLSQSTLLSNELPV